MNRFPIITLTTDYGVNDGYVASVKGVILSINPGANIIDICNTVEPQNIFQAAFIIGTVYRYFPAGSIHIAIVDPEVGSDRKSIILNAYSAYFIAPDNGILSYILSDALLSRTKIMRKTHQVLRRVKLPSGCRVIEINNPDYWLKPVSETFHGRDIFAPVAAYLSKGTSVQEFGTPLNDINITPIPQPYTDSHGFLCGHIVHIDSFGNLITNIANTSLKNRSFIMRFGKFRIQGLTQYYATSKGLMALIGSTNYLEIALKNGSARNFLGANLGDIVQVIFE